MAKIKYIKCPRCDLNYIDSRQELCDICKAELGLPSKVIVDDIDLEDDNVILCPICKSSVISVDEEMCAACRNAQEIEKDITEDIEDDDKWKEYLDDEEEEQEEQIEIPLEELQDEEFNTVFDDEEELDDFDSDKDEDDFDYEYDDTVDEDEDDEEEDDDEDEED